MMKNFLIVISFFLSIMLQAQEQKSLNPSWKFKQVGAKKWMKAKVPGTVHTDLMANNVIPDPYYRDNENKVQWVGKKDWEYKSSFSLSKKQLDYNYALLEFEGLDTYADVFLNGKKVLHTDNMFRTWAEEVRSLLKEKNELHIVFFSAERIADSLAKAALPLVRPSENNRHYIRKAQYHFGWDWGPKLITCGIWRNINLKLYNAEGFVEIIPDEKQKPKVELIRENDVIGQSFYFKIDGKPTFMKGANWIPADMFLPRITKAKYRELLVAAKEANFNMIRVWGGGIYEDDYFYELCDSLNIYVWQDFMFAGAMYPGDKASLENIRQEAIDNITRLNKFKCIVLWCGNNEIDEAWHNWGWQKQFNISNADTAKVWNEYKSIFQELLPSIVKEYAPTIPYVSTSPQFGWGRKESMTHGDAHYWGLWHGVMPISIMKEKVPRFMSEYGMQAMPNMETIRKFALPKDFDTASVVMKVHQKHNKGYKNLDAYMKMENLQPKTFEEYVAASQEIQHRAIETSVTAQMNSNGRCMGTLFWQLNDCWPVTSWSIIDYYGKKKKGYHTMKKLYAQEVPFVEVPKK